MRGYATFSKSFSPAQIAAIHVNELKAELNRDSVHPTAHTGFFLRGDEGGK